MDETLEEILKHHGVKGMKWGVRKRQEVGARYHELRNKPTENVTLKTPAGKEVTLKEEALGKLPAAMGSISPRIRKSLSESRMFQIHTGGQWIGNVTIHEKSKDELNFEWIGVVPEHRGKGYASTIFDAGLQYAKQKGYSKVSLEVPGIAPDARHIYEKRGFKPTGQVLGHKHDLWGGLTVMTYDIPKDAPLTHSAIDDELDRAFEQHFGAMGLDDFMFGETATHSDLLNSVLSHHGIRGMKWGVRKNPRAGVSKSKGTEVPASDDARRANNYHDRAHKHGPASLSNQELQHLVSRLNLEQQYARLRPPTGKEKAAKFVADTLLNVGKQQVSRAVNDYASKQVGDLLKNKK